MLMESYSLRGLYLLSLTALMPGHLTIDLEGLQVWANLSPYKLILSSLSGRSMIIVGCS